MRGEGREMEVALAPRLPSQERIVMTICDHTSKLYHYMYEARSSIHASAARESRSGLSHVTTQDDSLTRILVKALGLDRGGVS
jgi:hypothetical protein